MTAHRVNGRLYYASWPTPDGPWHDEPDRVEFESHGFPCLLVRGTLGAWCGYVGTKPGHPWHRKPYDSVDADVHGGLTYGRECEGVVCHESADGDDLWWLGFDCAHFGDVIPGALAIRGLGAPTMIPPAAIGGFETYRTVEFARSETEHLARQAQVAEGVVS